MLVAIGSAYLRHQPRISNTLHDYVPQSLRNAGNRLLDRKSNYHARPIPAFSERASQRMQSEKQSGARFGIEGGHRARNHRRTS